MPSEETRYFNILAKLFPINDIHTPCRDCLRPVTYKLEVHIGTRKIFAAYLCKTCADRYYEKYKSVE